MYFNNHILLGTISLCLLAVLTNGHVTELLLDDEIPPRIIASSSSSGEEHSDDIVGTCHVEYTVMKRGRCVKLGRNTRGCMSGSYIHPFHPECL